MIIGIDLGTTNSLIGYFSENGPCLIPNALDHFLTPSAVHLGDNKKVITGDAAKQKLVTHPDRTIAKFKRLMGTHKQLKLGKQIFRPEDLSALILKSLKQDAEQALGETITEAVISVPAYFNDIQRKATIAAAEIAGLQVKRLINEPTAAALAYGLHEKEDENTFLIVDLGGGTFDVSILEMFSGVMEVRASAGDAFLGGEDFTDRITSYFCEQAELTEDKLAEEEFSRLRALADRAKHLLGEREHVSLFYRYRNQEITLSITLDKFEEISLDLLNRLKFPLQRAISDANLKTNDIDRIVLVGGATRMPMIRNLITRLFQRFPEHHLDPDTIVALGTTIQAGLIARDKALEDIIMTDVCPFTLGYETSRKMGENKYEHGFFSPLIERNTTIPASRNESIYPLELGQKQLRIEVYQGESPYVKDNIKIGGYKIDLPYNKKEYEEVDIRFTYDNSGILEVVSTVVSTQKEAKLIIENTPGTLTPDEIKKRFDNLAHLKIHPREDAPNQALIARISAAYENALGERRDILSRLLSDFQFALDSQDQRIITEKRNEISEQLIYLEDMSVFD